MQPIRESGLSQDSCQLCRRARADVRVQPCGHAVHSRCCLFWPLPACPVCSAACQHIMLLPFYPYFYNGREHTAASTTPELRVGAWGPEELKYTYALIDAWSKGILPVSRHAKARNMLTTLLHCLPARLSAKIRLGRAEKIIQLQPNALDAKEVLQLRLQAKQTFELEEAFLQQETFKTADPNLTAGLLLVMQQEWQRQLVDLCTERGQKFYHQPKKPTIPPPRVPTATFPLPGGIPPPPAAATAPPPLPLVPPPLERVHLSTLFEAPPAPTNVSSPTIRGRQARNLEEGLDCFQQIVDVLHNITDENGRADAQQYAIEAVTEVCCYHQKARSLVCSAEGELLHASHDLQCTLTREAVVGILQATSIGPKTHWCDGNLLIGETVTVVAGAPCQVRSIHYLGLVFLVLSNAGRSGSVSSQPGDRSSLRKRKDCATPTTLSADNTHRKSLASSTRSSTSYFEDDEFDDDYRRSSEDRCRRLTSPSVCTSEPSMSSSISSTSSGPASLSQHLQRFLDFIPFEAVDLWVPVNAGGETRLYSGAWAISEPSLIDWIKYSRDFSFPPNTPIPGTVYGSRSPEVYNDLSALPADFSARADGAKRYGIKGCLALPIAMADGTMLVGMWYSQQPYTAPREMVQYITDVVQSWKADVKLEYLPSVAPSNELEPTGLYSEDVLTHVF